MLPVLSCRDLIPPSAQVEDEEFVEPYEPDFDPSNCAPEVFEVARAAGLAWLAEQEQLWQNAHAKSYEGQCHAM